MNADLFATLSVHADWFTARFGTTKPEHYVFPFGKPTPSDPTRHITDITGAWDALRKRAGVKCRFHDLRHTAATKMAEAGVPEKHHARSDGSHEPRNDGAILSHSDGCKAGGRRSLKAAASGPEFRSSTHKIPHTGELRKSSVALNY